MAVTISVYNHTQAKLSNLDVDAEASNFYVVLLDGTTAFDATHTTLAQAGDSGNDEVSGNGWPAAGYNLTSVTSTTVDTDGWMLDAANVSQALTGTVAADAAVVMVDEGGAGTTKSVLFHIDFGETKTRNNGENYEIQWDANGIYRVTIA